MNAEDRYAVVSSLSRQHSDSEPAQRTFDTSAVTANIGIFLALATGLVLRWARLGGESLWLDEGYTALQTSLSLHNLMDFARSETYPPLYPLLQHGWNTFFGDSEVSLRGLPALCGTISLLVFWALAKKVLRETRAVTLAVWLFSLSIVQVWYSREARTYELSSLLALVGLYLLICFLERRSVAFFAGIVVAVAASLYTHNMMFFYLFAFDIAWLTYPSERSRAERFKEVFLANFLMGILYLPWVPSLLSQTERVNGSFWIHRPTLGTLVGTVTYLSGFDPDYLLAIGSRVLPSLAAGIWIGIWAGLGILTAMLFAGWLLHVAKPQRTKGIALVIYGLLPILMVFVFSQISRPLFVDRVFIASSIVMPILLAFPLAVRTEPKLRQLYGFLGVALALVAALSTLGYMRNHHKEDWRGVTNRLLADPTTKRLVVLAPTGGETIFHYYQHRWSNFPPKVVTVGLPKSFLEGFPPRIGAITGPTDIGPLQLALRSSQYSEVDFAWSAESSDDLNHLVLAYLHETFLFRGEEQFHGVTLDRFSAREP